jgi:hypothetical protein
MIGKPSEIKRARAFDTKRYIRFIGRTNARSSLCSSTADAPLSQQIRHEEPEMKKTALLLAAIASLAMVSEASAWSRNRSVSSAQGTAHFSASGSCAGGSCSRSATRTGPRGNSLSATSSATCSSASQSCSRSKTYTGSNGGSATVQGSVSR